MNEKVINWEELSKVTGLSMKDLEIYRWEIMICLEKGLDNVLDLIYQDLDELNNPD